MARKRIKDMTEEELFEKRRKDYQVLCFNFVQNCKAFEQSMKSTDADTDHILSILKKYKKK